MFFYSDLCDELPDLVHLLAQHADHALHRPLHVDRQTLQICSIEYEAHCVVSCEAYFVIAYEASRV